MFWPRWAWACLMRRHESEPWAADGNFRSEWRGAGDAERAVDSDHRARGDWGVAVSVRHRQLAGWRRQRHGDAAGEVFTPRTAGHVSGAARAGGVGWTCGRNFSGAVRARVRGVHGLRRAADAGAEELAARAGRD